MCKRSSARKIPLAEVWKRRFVLSSICLVILTLVGLVMLAVELTKLQREVYNVVTTVGLSISLGGTLPLYLIFGYTILRHDQYPTGPVLVWANALYMLIGVALVCVAQIVPADSMFHMISFETMERDNYSGFGPIENETTVVPLQKLFGKDITIRNLEKDAKAVWNRELVHVIQVRVSALGGGILTLGLLGGGITLIIIYKTYRFIENRKEAELIRRKNIRTLTRALKPKNPQALKRLRDSVYDYAGWGNRTSDIYREPENEGRISNTPSILSTKLTSASLVSVVEESAGNQFTRRAHRNHDSQLEKIGEYSQEKQNGEFNKKTSVRDRSFEAIGASSYEMKELNVDADKELMDDKNFNPI